ncbi:MAG: peptidylprolyl isomerase [Acidobacteria bacterium]|nr:peptidylprolyl isomerase [Acidobacteriota bacterium]
MSRSIAVTFLICLVSCSLAPAAFAQAAPAFDPALLKPGSLTEKAPEVFEVKFETTKGDFVVKVTRAWAPNGADRFYNLVKHGYYNGAAFFRVLDGFMAQFGIHANPQVNAQWYNAMIKDDPVKKSNLRGYITYAMGGPNTRTTQLFINYTNNARLDADGFSPFGQVTQGMGIVDRLYSGYGEGAPGGRGPRQDLIQSRGSAYLEKEFPKLDTIKSATLLPPAPPKK